MANGPGCLTDRQPGPLAILVADSLRESDPPTRSASRPQGTGSQPRWPPEPRLPRRLTLEQLLAEIADPLVAALEAVLDALHALHGVFKLLHAVVQLGDRLVRVEQAGRQLLDRRLDLLLEDLQELAAVVL